MSNHAPETSSETPEKPPGIELEQITYLRQKKDPTLKQFIRRKATQAAAQEAKGQTGTVLVEGRPVPRSSVIMQEKLKVDTHVLAAEHPEWVNEYKEVYGGQSTDNPGASSGTDES